MDYISKDPSKIFNSVGANDSFVTICLDINSDEFKKFGSPLSGILHYTQNQRKYFLGEKVKLGIKEDISFLKLNTLDLKYAPEIKKSLIQEGISIHSIEQIIVTPQDDVQREIPKSHKNKIIIPLAPEKDALENERMLVFLYQKYLESGIKFLKSEKEKFVGVYMGLFGAFPEDILVKIQLDPSDLKSNWRIHHHYLSTKKKREGLTDVEDIRLKECEAIFFGKWFCRWFVNLSNLL
ncbi:MULTISPECIES: hypothetical protein [unclassified Leptospira]|uniref:hypothetical protein n=1 Tax=unclassified Leptospira TaxID=2633828 RepID=UPI0002BEC513|nr:MULTISPECIES: hypothetical protein [unclassified Leptospira]EMK02348.1 hypothetical protein LEP1GSC192_1755 [Leptospira sp. B5-022]MCR1795785.1 hypothetical protein [Leptospira sp. id769339]